MESLNLNQPQEIEQPETRLERMAAQLELSEPEKLWIRVVCRQIEHYENLEAQVNAKTLEREGQNPLSLNSKLYIDTLSPEYPKVELEKLIELYLIQIRDDRKRDSTEAKFGRFISTQQENLLDDILIGLHGSFSKFQSSQCKQWLQSYQKIQEAQELNAENKTKLVTDGLQIWHQGGSNITLDQAGGFVPNVDSLYSGRSGNSAYKFLTALTHLGNQAYWESPEGKRLLTGWSRWEKDHDSMTDKADG